MKKLTKEQMSAVMSECAAYGLTRGGRQHELVDGTSPCFFEAAEEAGYSLGDESYGDETCVFDEYASTKVNQTVTDPDGLLMWADFHGYVK